MTISKYILSIQSHLIEAHTDIFAWFEKTEELKNYRPADGGWTVREILEHISLTSYFLLKLIDKGTNKSIRNVRNLSLEEELSNFDFNLNEINEIGIHKSFDWIRPSHMEPTGTITENEIKSKMIEQVRQCLNSLDKLKNGEGLLFKTTMSVNNLGKINVYEYIYFLSKHAERHINQMKENEVEFLALENV